MVIAIKPLMRLPLLIDAVAASAKTYSWKYSGAPNFTANRATGTDMSTIMTVAMIPPMKEAIAEMARAASALPFRVIGYPSKVAATAAPSPGVLRRMEAREPPNIAP